MTALKFSDDLRSELEDLARDGYPREVCGLLLGRHDNGVVHVARVTQARNLNTERAHDRFELDPLHLVEMDEITRKQGMEIVGVWHTHPDHPARPSETDLAFAWKGWSYVIASVGREGVKDLRSWRLHGNGFVEEEIET